MNAFLTMNECMCMCMQAKRRYQEVAATAKSLDQDNKELQQKYQQKAA
jgi:hypothetical protein